MKICSIILLSLKNLLRDKKNIINIISISLVFSILVLAFSLKKSLNNYWENSVKKLVDYRTYVVSFDSNKYNTEEAIEKVQSFEHVSLAYSPSSYLISMKVNEENYPNKNGIFLVGTVSDPVKLSLGENLDTLNSAENPIICAKQFYPYVEKKQEDYIKSKSIDLSNRLYKNINLSFISSDKIEQFKIVGLYDAQENHIEGNVCYTKPEIVDKLNRKYQYDAFYDEYSDGGFIYLVIDNLSNEKEVSNKLSEEGFNVVLPVLHINKDLGNHIVNLLLFISLIILIFLSIMLTYTLFKKFDNRKKDYAIMKTSGYSNYYIILVYLCEILFLFIISFIISIMGYYILSIILQKLYISNKIVFYNLKIEMDYLILVINLLLSIVICFIISLYINIKLKKLEILNIIN